MARWHCSGFSIVCLSLILLIESVQLTSGSDLGQDIQVSDNALVPDKKSWVPDEDLDVADRLIDDPLEDKRTWGGRNYAVWGKRDQDLSEEEVKRKWGDHNKLWGKRVDNEDEKEKKAWGNNMRVWGKRDYQQLLAQLNEDKKKRQWGSDNLRVWGKRNPTSFKKWGNAQSMRVWGKRADNDNAEKRQWGKSMRVWGKRNINDELLNTDEDKRAWNEVSRVWGKRNFDEMTDEEKRAWGQGMRVWGKRNGLDGNEIIDTSGNIDRSLAGETEKKAWDKSMRVWGKRALTKEKRSINMHGDIDTGKRNTRIWGKRRDDEGGPKRSWKTNYMRVWGKRSFNEPIIDGLEDNDNEKRAWNTNSMRTWGKRSAEAMDAQKLADLLVDLRNS